MARWWLALLVVAALPRAAGAQATPSIAPQPNERRDVVSLREYIDVRLNALSAEVVAQHQASQLAIDKAENTVNLRLESMNEFRSQLKDQATQFYTKDEANTRTEVVDRRLAALDNQFASLNGTIRAVGAIWSLALVALAAWMNRRLPAKGR